MSPIFQGPYDIEIKSVETIKGPKQKSIATFSFNVTKENGDFLSHSNLTFLEQGRLEEVCNFNIQRNKVAIH